MLLEFLLLLLLLLLVALRLLLFRLLLLWRLETMRFRMWGSSLWCLGRLLVLLVRRVFACLGVCVV